MTVPKDLPQPKFSKAALEIIKKRYLVTDEKGNILETPDEMLWRVAKCISEADKKFGKDAVAVDENARRFYKMMAQLRFLPNSPVLLEAGTNHNGQYSACFVVPLSDSLTDIFQALSDAAVIQKNNGGTGFNFSPIRPRGSSVRGIPNVAAGPIHYLKTFDTALSQILQGSKRHGGNMGILNVDHPDILDFIKLKDSGSSIKNFNISVGITDDFMEKVKNNKEYDLKNPHNNEVVRKIKAREVFDLIAKKAWECADPGAIYLDRIQRSNPTPKLGKIDATNPCGEQPLLPYESCNLGSIVLTNHFRDGVMDWNMLRNTVRDAVHFMDNVIEENKFPLQKIDENVKRTRKIGLGIMGFSHMLYKLGIPYNSDEAIKLSGEIMKFIKEEGMKRSCELAKERGVFPAFEESIFVDTGFRPRNATLTTIAPTGSISLIAGCSSGIEPVFSLVSVRKALFKGDSYQEIVITDPVFEEVAKEKGFYSEELMKKIASRGSIKDLEEIPEAVRKVFVTSHDVSYEWHLKIQANAQKYTDNAVSKTINFPNDATIDQVKDAFMLSYELGCKGITIYRDGCKEFQIMGVKKEEKKPSEIKQPEEQGAKEEKAKLTPNAIKVLEKRALAKNEKGEVIETPEELFDRISDFVGRSEKEFCSDEECKKIKNKFSEVQKNLEFLCGGTLIFAGQRNRTLSKCFVLPMHDSINDIFNTVRDNIQILRSGGGTGFNLSDIRSSYSKVSSTGENAAGPVEFLRALNATMRTIKGRGGRKMGAMAILNIDHPDIETFIKCKDVPGEVENLNLSVGITNEFMEAVRDDKSFKLIDPRTKACVKEVSATNLFDLISRHAWGSGDPGVVFLDTIQKGNTVPGLGKMTATNPCGEQPLFPYESCNLGSVNLSRFVKDGKIDWRRLEDVVRTGVRFLDDITSSNEYVLPEIESATKRTRKSGLGIMGWADMLIKLGIPYNSKEATDMAEVVMGFVNKVARSESQKLGQERGSFPAFKESTFNGKYDAMRNATVTTIAPTGSISIVADCSAGIEPLFAISYTMQNSMGGENQVVMHPEFERIAKEEGFYSEELIEKVKAEGGVQHLDEVPEKVKRIFVTAHDIDPEWHVKMQASFQKYTDNAVSKTVNFKEDATVDQVKKAYMLAYSTGCKGITIYRDKSKDEQVLVRGSGLSADKSKVTIGSIGSVEPRERPEVVMGTTEVITTGCGPLHVTINEDENSVFEVFAKLGKSGGCPASYSESIGRLISIALRSGIDPNEIVKQLEGVRCPSPIMTKGGTIFSCSDGIALALKRYIERKSKLKLEFKKEEKPSVKLKLDLVMPKVEKVEKPTVVEEKKKEKVYTTNNELGYNPMCPECGGTVEFSEGCLICRSCGYSKCG